MLLNFWLTQRKLLLGLRAINRYKKEPKKTVTTTVTAETLEVHYEYKKNNSPDVSYLKFFHFLRIQYHILQNIIRNQMILLFVDMLILARVMKYVPLVKKLWHIQRMDLMNGFHAKVSWKKTAFQTRANLVGRF